MLQRLVNAIDGRLRASQGIFEYSSCPDCIFRIQLAISKDNLTLGDGTVVRPGDRIVVLHVWNEHLHAFPPGGPTLAWARQLSKALQVSLTELDEWLSSQPQFGDVRAIKAEMTFAAQERADQLEAISTRYGFETVDPPHRSFTTYLHQLGENVLIALLVFAHNPAALSISTLGRGRLHAFLPRSRLHNRFSPHITRRS